MIRTLIALSIVCSTASAAFARDLCIQIDGGTYAGSALVLKKAKVTPRSAAAAQGYLARYSAATNSFATFTPLYGQSIVDTTGRIAFGISFQAASVGVGGSTTVGSNPPQWISMTCRPSTGTTIRVLDPCLANVNGTQSAAHVVECSPATALP